MVMSARTSIPEEEQISVFSFFAFLAKLLRPKVTFLVPLHPF